MIIDYLDGEENIKVFGHCPKCNSLEIIEINCSTELGNKFEGYECEECEYEFDEPNWKFKEEMEE